MPSYLEPSLSQNVYIGGDTTQTTAEPRPQATSVSQPSSMALTAGEATSTVTQASSFKFITPTPLPTPGPGSQCNGTTEDSPSTSCEAIRECDPTAPSGYYWINSSSGVLKVLCSAGKHTCYIAMHAVITGGCAYICIPKTILVKQQ